MSTAAGGSNKPAPFVSVVTVSLNAAGTIEDTLASVALQESALAVEHICVDGGSRDATRDIIDRWANARPDRLQRVFEPDRGIYDAMNKGLRAARGEYVLYLNADDFLVAPDVLARALAGLAPGESGNPDLVLGDVVMGAPGRRGVWRRRRVPRLLGRTRASGFFPLHQGMLAKRRLLDAVNGFDTSLKLAADVNQFYDLERLHQPSIRFFDGDVSFMRAGGAANASFRAIRLGSLEIYRHLRNSHGVLRSCAMLMAKTLQSLTEVRYGQPPHARWFEERLRENRKSA